MSFHPRLSVNSICSMHQSLDEDLALWADLGIDHVGLITPKFDDPGWDAGRRAVVDAGLRVSSGLALIGAVVAEFVAGTGGRNTGLAYEILQSGFQLEIPRMFAALFLITVAGILLFLAMVALSRLALGSWHDSVAESEA